MAVWTATLYMECTYHSDTGGPSAVLVNIDYIPGSTYFSPFAEALPEDKTNRAKKSVKGAI